MENDLTIRRREEFCQMRRFGSGVAIGQVEDKTIRQYARREVQNGKAVVNGFGVQRKMQETPRLRMEIGIEKPEGVFEIAALRLKVVWPQVHSFRPDDPRKELHSAGTTLGERWRLDKFPADAKRISRPQPKARYR